MRPLEDVLGVHALLELQRWLNERYPSDAPMRPNAVDPVAVQEAADAWERQYRIERYSVDRREWWRVVDLSTGETAVYVAVNSRGVRARLGLKQDLMLSWDEARRAVDRLVHAAS